MPEPTEQTTAHDRAAAIDVDTSAETAMTVEEWVRQSRQEQGLPEKIEDEVIVTRVMVLAGLLRHPPIPPQSSRDRTPVSREPDEQSP